MLAVYDYNSREDSPNRGMELELSFKSGDTITVYGGMVSYAPHIELPVLHARGGMGQKWLLSF